MNILDILRRSQGGAAVGNVARAYGIAPDQADAAVGAIVTELSRAIERNTLNRGGVADLVTALGGGHERYLDKGANVASTEMQADGNAILGHIFGSKDKSRAVAARVASETGLGEAVIKQMLPTVAAMLMGALANGTKGALGGIIGRLTELGNQSPLPVPGANPRPASTSARPAGDAGGGVGRQSPLPIPGDDLPELDRGRGREEDGDNSYGDLGDIIRRGGYRIPGGQGGGSGGDPGASGGGSLADIVRTILGSLLGFQNKGIISWLIQLIVFRWGWGILKRILGRVVLGR